MPVIRDEDVVEVEHLLRKLCYLLRCTWLHRHELRLKHERRQIVGLTLLLVLPSLLCFLSLKILLLAVLTEIWYWFWSRRLDRAQHCLNRHRLRRSVDELAVRVDLVGRRTEGLRDVGSHLRKDGQPLSQNSTSL